MFSFSLPNSIIPRLSRLHLATDVDNPSCSTRHIGLRITPEHARFAATEGRILAAIITEIEDFQGTPCDVVLDVHQFNDGLRTIDRSIPQRSDERVTVSATPSEARFSTKGATAIVRLHQDPFPRFDHIFSRTAGQSWVPCVSSLSPSLIAIAQKIAGKTPILFSSPIPEGSTAGRFWNTKPSSDIDTITISDIRTAIGSPAYWSDGQLEILVMPITRVDGDRKLDLATFAMSPKSAVIAAA